MRPIDIPGFETYILLVLVLILAYLVVAGGFIVHFLRLACLDWKDYKSRPRAPRSYYGYEPDRDTWFMHIGRGWVFFAVIFISTIPLIISLCSLLAYIWRNHA